MSARDTCLLCGASPLQPSGPRAALCPHCGLLHNLDTTPVDYAAGGGQATPDAAKMRWRMLNARMRFRLIAPFLDGHALFIDIGCGSGEMLAVAGETFRHCIGFDTNLTLIDYVRTHTTATVIGQAFDPALIDPALLGERKLIALSHVLEHLEAPLKLLDNIVATMGSGDLLYLEVPLHTGRSFRTLGQAWNLWNHEHLALYSPDALDYVAGKLGLQVLHRGARIFARGSHSGKTRLKLLLESPVAFLRALFTKGRHSLADVLIGDYGCMVLRKP